MISAMQPNLAPKAPDFQVLPPEVGGNFCPFMAVNDLMFVQAPTDPKAVLKNPSLANAAMPALQPNVLKCLGEKCALWHAGGKCCSLKAGALAAVELLARAKTESLKAALGVAQ